MSITGIILTLAVCWAASVIIAVIFQEYIPFLLVAGYIYIGYLLTNQRYGEALLTGIGLVMVHTAYNIITDGELKGKKERKHYRKKERISSSWSGRWITYVIPIFWPYHIIRLFFGGKTARTDMSAYDYEQHLKSNAR